MIAFIVLFFPAVLAVWITETLNKACFSKREWLYRFAQNTLFINFVCFGVKKWILNTADVVICSFTADMAPGVACNYLIMAIPLAIAFSVTQSLFRKIGHFEVETQQDRTENKDEA